MHRSYYRDESGIRHIVFNNSSAIELATTPNAEIETYELVIIGALLYHIDQLVQKNANIPSVDLQSVEGFPHLNISVLIGQYWNLFDPADLQILFMLSEIFDANRSRFKEKPQPALSQQTKNILEKRLSASASAST